MRISTINMHEILLRFKMLISINCLLSDIKYVLNLFENITPLFFMIEIFLFRNIYDKNKYF